MNRVSFLILSTMAIILVFNSNLVSYQDCCKNSTQGSVEENTTICDQIVVKEEQGSVEIETSATNYAPETTQNISYWVVTGYCSCPECCGEYSYGRPLDENGNEIVYGASGNRLVPYYSCAADDSIPFGTIMRVCFENGGEIVVEVMDRGGAVYGNHIDLYCYDHEQALSVGKQTVRVEVLEWGD